MNRIKYLCMGEKKYQRTVGDIVSCDIYSFATLFKFMHLLFNDGNAKSSALSLHAFFPVFHRIIIYVINWNFLNRLTEIYIAIKIGKRSFQRAFRLGWLF